MKENQTVERFSTLFVRRQDSPIAVAAMPWLVRDATAAPAPSDSCSRRHEDAAIMPTTDLESLRKAVQEFRPNPHRVPFNNLKPFHDTIMELRGKNASYFIIAEVLQQNGVKTSRALVAEYGRRVLDGGKSRQPQISWPRPKVRQSWLQNPHRSRQHRSLRRRTISSRRQKRILYTIQADRTLPT